MEEKDYIRLESLMRLALNNNNSEEVRTTSVLIVKMIDKYKLLATIKKSVTNTGSSFHSNNPYTSTKSNSNPVDYHTYYNKPNSTKVIDYSKEFNFLHISENALYSKAECVIEYLINFLLTRKKIKSKENTISVSKIIEVALRDKLIVNSDVKSFNVIIRELLLVETMDLDGKLVGVRGRHGGYKLK